MDVYYNMSRRKDSVADDFLELANNPSTSPVAASIANHVAHLLQVLSEDAPELRNRDDIVECAAGLQAALLSASDHIQEIEEQLALLRQQIALDAKKNEARFKCIQRENDEIRKQIKSLKAEMSLEDQERSRSAAIIMRIVTFETENRCIEAVMSWNRRQRVANAVDGFLEFEDYIDEMPPLEQTEVRNKLARQKAAFGISSVAGSMTQMRKAGNGLAHERFDLLSKEDVSRKITVAVSAFPVRIYDSSTGKMVEVSKSDAQAVANVYLSLR